MLKTILRLAALIVLVMTAGAGGQNLPNEDRWARMRFLLGSWEGPTEGQSGNGIDQRRYGLTLRDRFIEVHNTSTYPAQEKNPKGEVHQDVGFISYDNARKRLVLPDAFEQIFELAEPGKPFEVYSHAQFKRVGCE